MAGSTDGTGGPPGAQEHSPQRPRAIVEKFYCGGYIWSGRKNGMSRVEKTFRGSAYEIGQIGLLKRLTAGASSVVWLVSAQPRAINLNGFDGQFIT